uniref:Uncharacterized protein n=1 Tax=Oryza meridionalis TaxID=40149 RepID=A0A0E0DT99_9ORYZ
MCRVMEMRPRDLATILAMSCLLLLPLLVSSVPVSGIVHLSSQQQHPSSRNIYADDMVVAATDLEVNDYPAPGANPRHNPKRPPGREMSVQDMVAETTNVEVNDYPAPGANPRHNPKRPPGRE